MPTLAIWRWKLHWQVFLGMLAGALLALVAPRAAELVTPLGTIFMRLLRMVIVPLIFTSIVSGAAGIGDPRSLGRLGLKTLAYYMATSLLAIVVGLTLANTLRPGAGLELATGSEISPEQLETPGSMAEVLLRMIPENPLAAAAQGDILGLIFFALVFGLAITTLPGGAHERLNGFFQAAFEAMMLLTRGIISLAPIGVFGLIAGAIGTMGFGVFQQVGKYMLVIALGLSIHLFIVLPLIFRLFTGINPIEHYRVMMSAAQLAFSTSSSSATLPATMSAVENDAGVSNKISSFVLPLGATINMDGTALYECAGVLFIAQALDVGLSLPQQLLVVMTALLASIGAAGIPSAGLVMIFIVLDAVNLNNEAAFALVGLMLAVDRPLDMFRTTVNITSDSIGAVIIAKSEGETLRYEEKEKTVGAAET